MTATQKQVKRALYNGLPNLSDRELRQMIDRELEKDSSQIDMNYIDTCFDLMEMHADGRIAVQPRRKWLKAVIVAALIAAATVSAMSVSAHLFNFNIPSEIAHKINGSAQIDPNLAEADTSAAGYALTASPVAKQLAELGISPVTLPRQLAQSHIQSVRSIQSDSVMTAAQVLFEADGVAGDLTVTRYATANDWEGKDRVTDIDSGKLVHANGLDILILARDDSCTLRYRDGNTEYDLYLECDEDTAVAFAHTKRQPCALHRLSFFAAAKQKSRTLKSCLSAYIDFDRGCPHLYIRAAAPITESPAVCKQNCRLVAPYTAPQRPYPGC